MRRNRRDQKRKGQHPKAIDSKGYLKAIDSRRLLAQRRRSITSTRKTTISLLSRFKGDYYRCPHCKLIIPKDEAKLSGYNSEHSQRHVHCPRCGGTAAWVTNGSTFRNILEGFGSIALGSTMAYVLFPFLNIYAWQIGFFTGLYGTLKILMRLDR